MSRTVMNRISVDASNDKEIIYSLFSEYEEGGDYFVDFNNVISAPNDLETYTYPDLINYVNLYLTSINPSVDYFGGEKISLEQYDLICEKMQYIDSNFCWNGNLTLKEIAAAKSSLHIRKDQLSKAFAEGKQIVDNAFKYDHISLENWQYANWGSNGRTWDSDVYECSVYFKTDGYDARLIAQKLSQKYPDSTIYFDYAHAIVGTYSGSFEYKDGKLISGGDYPFKSYEGYDSYFLAFGERKDYVFDENLNNFKRIDLFFAKKHSEM